MSAGKTGRGGSGMFYLASIETDMTAGVPTTATKLTLKPNPHWWGIAAGKKPHLSEIDLLTGNLDTFLGDASIGYGDVFDPRLLQSALPQIKRAPYFRETQSLSMAVLHFNWKQAPFDDLNARKAFCLAIDRQQLNQQTMQGVNIPSWHTTPQGMDGYNAQLRGLDDAPVTGNAALARYYWQRYLATHNHQAPRVSIPGWGLFPNAINAATPLSQMWKQVLDVDVPLYTSDVQESWFGAQINDFVESIGYPDPEDVLSWMSAANDYGISVPAADPLLRRADALSDMARRIPLYQQAEQLLIDNVAICPLFQVMDAYALRPWVKGGFAQSSLGVVPNDAWVSGYIARH